MDHFKGFLDSVNGMKRSFNGMINNTLTPEMKAAMSPEQLEAVEMGKNAFDMKGKTPQEKLNHINKNLEHVFSVIK